MSLEVTASYETVMTYHSTTVTYANRDEAIADDVRQKWISTLAVGNGAALFLLFTVAIKDGALLAPPVSLSAGWLFFAGLIASSFAFLCLSASHRQSEIYWRLSYAKFQWDDLKEVEKAKALETDISNSDKLGNKMDNIATWSAIASSVMFICGVGTPLSYLPFLALTA